MRYRFTRLAWLLALLSFMYGAGADQPTVHIVVTQRAPVVDRLILEVQRSTRDRAKINVIDMKGKPGNADELISDMGASLRHNDIVLALGAPAMQAALRKAGDHPLVCAMTTAGTTGNLTRDRQNVHFADDDPSVQDMVAALGTVWKGVTRVAVLSTGPAKTDLASTEGREVTWHTIQRDADVVEVLETLADSVDGFVFPREATVLNRRNIEAVTAWLARNRKPAIGYSRFLVNAGFPAALGADDVSSRRRIAEILGALLDERKIPEADGHGSIWLNRKSLQTYGITPSSLEVQARLL